MEEYKNPIILRIAEFSSYGFTNFVWCKSCNKSNVWLADLFVGQVCKCERCGANYILTG